MDFSQSLKIAKSGGAIRRAGWNGAGLTVKMAAPDDSAMLPFLFIEYPLTAKTTPGAKCPWVPSQTDLMAEDWDVVVASCSGS